MDEALTTRRSLDRASLDVSEQDGGLVLALQGVLDADAVGYLWSQTLKGAARAAGAALVFDLNGVTSCDTAGVTLLLAAERAHRGGVARLNGGPDGLSDLWTRVRAAATVPPQPPPPRPPGLREALHAGWLASTGWLVFIGEVATRFARLPSRRRMWRWSELLTIADEAGVRAVPLAILLGALMGLILSFQSLIPLRRFGADIYVSNLVAISLLRELGPLLAAIILAGRTGSAFAAELGTMKVNEELDALEVLGLDPMTMLVLPRLVAATLITPALTIILEIAGMSGMVVVLDGFGFPPVAVLGQVARWVRPRDLFGGLFKAAVFGAVIAAIGCRAGLKTGHGPRAVGVSATAAVVGGIVASVVIDGLFALVFWQLGL